MAADVAGYSRLMGADEVGTLEALKAHRREVVDPAIVEHNGRIFKTTGDGLLAEFGSVVDAVVCAMAIQGAMAARKGSAGKPNIVFRIGINVGDIIIDGDDMFGDGVNLAARVEHKCEPGQVCLSSHAFEQVRNKTPFIFDDLGERKLKNIKLPVRIYAVRIVGKAVGPRPRLSLSFPEAHKPPPLPEKPSIAVLPFQNMSDDPQQEYFADGMVEDIITALSRFKQLFVIARNSSFTFRGKAVEIKQVGHDLGVRYVLEGSVRKAGNRVRITGQLIDTMIGAHIWADRFDGGLEEIFELQDRVATSVVGAIAPRLEQAEIERAKRKPTESLDAYDYFLRGSASLYRWTKNAHDEALGLFRRAIEIDPDFAPAYAFASWCYLWRQVNGWTTDHERETAEAGRLARRAAELGKDDAVALAYAGQALARVTRDLKGGAALIDRSIAINPNLSAAWRNSGWVRVFLGEPEAAIEHLTHAMRLSPLDPFLSHLQQATAMAHFCAGRYDDALSWTEKALHEEPDYAAAARLRAVSFALARQLEHASSAMIRFRQLDPVLRLSNLGPRLPPLQPHHYVMYVEGLRKAGLPE